MPKNLTQIILIGLGRMGIRHMLGLKDFKGILWGVDPCITAQENAHFKSDEAQTASIKNLCQT